MSWYFNPYRQERSGKNAPENLERRIAQHGLDTSELWGVTYYHCPHCRIPRADISDAITCASLCKLEQAGQTRYRRNKTTAPETEAEHVH